MKNILWLVITVVQIFAVADDFTTVECGTEEVSRCSEGERETMRGVNIISGPLC